MSVISFGLSPNEVLGQKPIQLNGVVMSDDSIPQLIPYCNIFVVGRNQGTISGEDGFFSIAIMPGDTVQFSVMGFKKEKFPIPDTIKRTKHGYLAEIHLARDTAYLREVVIYPWPSPDRLKAEFMSIRVPTTDLEIAQRNLMISALRERAAAMGYDASEMSKEIMRQQSQYYYERTRYGGLSGGTAMLMNLSNPFAWHQLFESLKK
ncbi:MAG: carboxypeptidase-like regulatory domain-containing protein [Cryomorphaceae bacterium]|nr:carboxypeptidase-like regulatory domain-containing protein [Cryomorphaceae bacterium]